MEEKNERTPDETFARKGREVAIRTEGDRVEIVLDGEVHEVRFLDDGRPYTKEYVNVMATSVRDLAERWVDSDVAQRAHWAEVDVARAKEAAAQQAQDPNEIR